jgi:hypothetical protein
MQLNVIGSKDCMAVADCDGAASACTLKKMVPEEKESVWAE